MRRSHLWLGCMALAMGCAMQVPETEEPDDDGHDSDCPRGYAGFGCVDCAAGYRHPTPDAARCEEDLCAAVDCGAFGSCSDDTGACVCSVGFAGPACDACAEGHIGSDCASCVDGLVLDGGHCVPNACVGFLCGHGTCVLDDGVAACSCDAGYAGDTCESCAEGFYADTSDGTCNLPRCTEPRDVLFIGDTPSVSDDVAELSGALGCELDITTRLVPGFGFREHFTSADTLDAITQGAFDVVVLQELTQLPAYPGPQRDMSRVAAKELVHLIRTHHPAARILYARAPAFRDGDTQNCSWVPSLCDFDGQDAALALGYAGYAELTHGKVADVGTAWRDVVEDTNPPLSPDMLWNASGTSASARGSYLSAAVLTGTIFNVSPLGSSYEAGLAPEEAAYLQQIADAYTHDCGNGVVDPGEACDDVFDSGACDFDCTMAMCGDTYTNLTSLESCDDGNVFDDDHCSSTCSWQPDVFEPDDDVATSNFILLDELPITGHSIVSDSDVDFFSFEASVGSLVIVGPDPTWCASVNHVELSFTLINSAMNEIGTRTGCDTFEFFPPATATYHLRVDGLNLTYGSYEIVAREVHDDVYEPNDYAFEATPVPTLPASLHLVTLANYDWFALNVVAGNTYHAALSDVDCSPGDGRDIDLSVHDESEAWVAGAYEQGSGQCAAVTWTAAVDGVNYVVVSGFGHPGDSYTLTISNP